jgi:hypothetical protein
VAPVVLAAQLLQVLFEKRTHGDDAQPLLVQRGVVQDLGGNTSTVDRGVGVERSHKDLDLRINLLLLFDSLAHNGESTNTLAVETLTAVSVVAALTTFYILTMFLAKL